MSARTTTIAGHVDPGFEAVARAFEAGLDAPARSGAAFAAVHDGRLVVDLWGGVADADGGRPWARDSLQLVFSGTKGLVAVCMLILIERGALDLDTRVADCWPEFAAAGKGSVRIRDVVAHAARLPGVSAPLAVRDLREPERVAALLAAQPLERDPRAHFIYHPLTYGWLCGELVRRVDGRTIGTFFAEEVARPLGLEVWIGLPPAQERRVTVLHCSEGWAAESARADAPFADDELARTVNRNPPLFPAGPLFWNAPELHAAEVPGGGGIGTARDIARLYGCLARGGELGGVRILAAETVALGARELSRGVDPLTGSPLAFGVGFQLQTERRRYGPPMRAFGHDGAGGSVHGAWPDQRLGFSYAMNELRWVAAGEDPRTDPLLRALHDAVATGA